MIVFFSIFISKSYANINVGTVVYDPPYVISTSQGFEIEFIKLLCSKIKEQCTFLPMNYYELFTALNNKKIDIAVDGIDFYITPNQLNGNYIYSYPYLLSQGQFLVLKNSGIKDLSTLPQGAKIGTVQENKQPDQGIFYDYFMTHYSPKYNLVLFADVESLIAALGTGKISAAFMDENQSNYWSQNMQGQFLELVKPFKVADGIGIMALPSQKKLIQKLNQQIKIIENSPEYIQLYNTYISQ